MPKPKDNLCVTVFIDDREYILDQQDTGQVKVFVDGDEDGSVELDNLHYALAQRIYELENQLALHKEKHHE